MFQSLSEKWTVLKNKFKKNENEVNDMPPDDTVLYDDALDVPPEMQLHEETENFVAEPENVLAQEDDFAPKKKMSVVKVVVLTLVLLLVAALGGGYYYISHIDWNQHRNRIAAEFSDMTGKRIVFEGPIHLNLFPSPRLQAENIKIFAPNDDGAEPLAKIKSLEANLTLNSLLNGDLDVKMMSLVDPDIRLEILENGSLNWDTPLTDLQRENLESMQIMLDSVMVKNATIHWIDDAKKQNYVINNINAEVIAQSIFGPYRIEGTYIKNNNPEGFAFSIGKITSGLSTSINAVINQPSTETFVRFDGSVLPQNNAINGNLIFESKKLMDFVNSNSETFKLKPEYDYPLAVTLELKSNKQKVEISNFAVKYGDSAGAGNVLIPLNAGEYKTQKQDEVFRPKVEFGFNFASLDMAPVSQLLLSWWNKYKTGEANYNPKLDFDILADVKAVKATYNNQAIKDFKISLDVLDNKIVIRDLSAVFPGDASFSLSGDVYSDLGYLTFDLKPNLKTDEFRQMLSWLGVNVPSIKDTLLRRIDANAQIRGNFNKVSISPLNINLDNSQIVGEIGLINDEKFNIYAALKSSVVNMDDYFPTLLSFDEGKKWNENVDSLFKKLTLPENVYAELRLQADTLIYNSLPYAGVGLNGNLQQGNLQITSLLIENMAGAKLMAKGNIKGFGQKAEAENLKFDLSTKDFNGFANKLKLPLPDMDRKKFNNFTIKGIVTGFADKFATKTIAQLEDINLDFGGVVELKNGDYGLRGNLELKSPDFVKMVNDFNFHYNPQTYVLGLFNFKGKFDGNLKKFAASDLQFNIGSNSFKGWMKYDNSLDKPLITTELDINHLELNKFFYNNLKVKASENKSFRQAEVGKVDFLAQPNFDDEKFNFDFLRSFDFSGKFNISRLSYQNYDFDYCKFGFETKDNVAKLSEFVADFYAGKIKTNFELSMAEENPRIQGNIVLNNYEIPEQVFSGAKYGLMNGLLNLSVKYASSAVSFAEMYNNLTADGSFQFFNMRLKGWNIQDIHEDLLVRTQSQGLTAFVKQKLMDGKERLISAEGLFHIKDGRLSVIDSEWMGEGYRAMLDADVSLQNWEGNLVYDVDFDVPDYLPNFAVIYSGRLNAPKLDVNVENLAAMYNQRQRELQAKEAQKQAELKEKMRKNLDNSLLKTKAMLSEVVNVVRPDLDLKSPKAKMPEIVTMYKNLDRRVKAIETSLSQLLMVAQKPDISEDVIKDVDAQNERNARYVEDIKAELNRVNLENLKYSIAQINEYVQEQNDKALDFMEKYKIEKKQFDEKLAQNDAAQLLDKDDSFLRLVSAFESNVVSLNKVAESIQTEYQNVDAGNEFELDKFYMGIASLQKDVERYSQEIPDAFEQLTNYAQTRIKIVEEAYQRKKHEEEIKKKLEENIGSISVKDTGVSKTVIRDLEDIEKSEKAVDSQKVRVLDFSEPEKESQNTVVSGKKTSTTPKKTSNLVVKKVDGEISKATGVIIKK